jgi:hypothetical protein
LDSPSIQVGPFPDQSLLLGVGTLGASQTHAFWAGLGNRSVIKRLEATFG